MTISHTELPRDILEISGGDQRSFLQGLISQDIGKVTPERSVYSTLLTPQGKYLHDFIILQEDDRLIFDCEKERSADLAKRLSRFKLRADVSLTPRSDMQVFAVFGDGANKTLGLAPGEGSTARTGAILLTVDPRQPALGCRLVGPKAEVQALLQAREIQPAGFDAYEQLRISLGVPDGSKDLEIEKSILLESNIDDLHGIDWEKGCYMGQELTARTKYRGLVKRGLFAFETTESVAKPGDPILSGAKVVGEVRSANGKLVLASVRIDALKDPATPVALEQAPLHRITGTH